MSNKKRLIIMFSFCFFTICAFLYGVQLQAKAADGDSVLPDTPIQYITQDDSFDKHYNTYPSLLNSNNKSDIPGVLPSDEPIPFEFSFSPLLTSKTRYYLVGPDGSETLQKSDSTSSIRTKTTIRVTNVGYYNKRAVDMLYTVLDDVDGYSRDSKGRFPGVSVKVSLQTITSGMSKDALATAKDKFMYSQMTNNKSVPAYAYTIQYIYHDENNNVNQHEPVKNMKGILNSGRFSYQKGFYLDPSYYVGGRTPSPKGVAYNIYSPETYKNGAGSVWLSNTLKNAAGMGKKDDTTNRFTELYSAKDGRLKMTNMRTGITILRYSIQPQTVSPVLLPSPSVIGVKNENVDNKNVISWDVRQAFPSQPSDLQLDNYSFKFSVPKKANLDLSKLKITNEADDDLTNDFTAVYDGGTGTVTVSSSGASAMADLINDDINFHFSGVLDPRDTEMTKTYLSKNNDGYVSMKGNAISADYSLVGKEYHTGGDSDNAQTKLNIFPGKPEMSKTFTNFGDQTGKNRVGDMLDFELTAKNGSTGSGLFASKLADVHIVDKIPYGLNLDRNTLMLNNQPLTSGDYSYVAPTAPNNPGTLTLTKAGINLSDGQTAKLTYSARIAEGTEGKTLINSAEMTAMDTNILTPKPVGDESSVTIEVAKTFIKDLNSLVKNVTAGDSDFKNETTALKGDRIDFKVIFNVPSDSDDFSIAGIFSGSLPSGLSLAPNTVVKIIGPGANDATTSTSLDRQITIQPVTAGQKVIIQFQAIVDNPVPEKGIIYAPSIIGGTLDEPLIIPSKPVAKISPKDELEFLSVPDDIDFGTVQALSGNLSKKTNISTKVGDSEDQTLVVENNSSKDNSYDVAVSYDNTGEGAMKNGEDTLTPAGNDGMLLFINQKQGNEHNWVPISTSGTNLQSEPIKKKGKNDMTDYVGKGQWQMRAKDDQNVKSGVYSGTLTWSLSNVLPNNP